MSEFVTGDEVFESRTIRRGPQVDLLEDIELAVRSFRRGTRTAQEPCELTVSVNGTERLHVSEPAGPMASAQSIIDLRIQQRHEAVLVGALNSCPWRNDDVPVIPYQDTSTDTASIRYLICTASVRLILDAIRTALDIPEGAAMIEQAETLLDAAWGDR